MIQSKKGAEIALNVIIIAVIALLVLVVVIFIFSGRSAVFSKGVSSCETIGGECLDVSCLQATPPRPTLAGDCQVPEGAPRKYCCSKSFT